MARRQTTCISCAVRMKAKDLEQGFKFPTKMGWLGASLAAASPLCSPWGYHGGRRKAGYLLKGTASLVRFISFPPVHGDTGKVKTVANGKMLGGPETILYAYHPNIKLHRPLFSSEPKVGKRWPTCQIGPATHFCK